MEISVVLVAAGKGKRLGGIDKSFIKIRGKEAILYSLNVFLSFPNVKEIIVVLNSENIKKARKLISDEKVKFVLGGDTRAESVKNGVMQAKLPFVMVHDAARPFITDNLLRRIADGMKETDAVIPVLKVKHTIKQVEDGFVKTTLSRESLVLVQTPQFFRREQLLKAYDGLSLNGSITDEAMLIEKMGGRIKVVNGMEENIKITTPFDLIILEGIIGKWNGK